MERFKFNSLYKWFWPRRLANQIALLTILLFGIGIIFISVNAGRENAKFIINQIQQSGQTLAKNISVTGSAYLFSTYYGPLEELLKQAADFPNVDELEILDTEGVVVREAKRLSDGSIKISQEKHRYAVPTDISKITVSKNDSYIEIFQPIVSGILQGWVRVEMGLDKLNKKQNEVYRSTYTLVGSVLILILVAVLMYMRRPMHTLDVLTSFASQLIAKYGESLPVEKGCEELQKLGNALNKVSNELQEQDVEIHKALKSLEEQKTALDLHSIVSIADVRGNITYANDKFCEVSGYSHEELLGQNHRIIKSDVHNDAFYKELWVTIARGHVWKGEVCNQAKNGNQYWVETTIVPFLDEQNKPYQYVAIRTEITSLKKITEILIESQQRLEQSQAFSKMGSWDWDIVSGDVIWSGHVAEMFKLENDHRKTSFSNFFKSVHRDDGGSVLKAIESCLDGGEEYDVEHRVVLPGGAIRWIHGKGNVIRGNNGNPIRMLGVVQDITERKETEKNMHLLEAQIVQSQKMEAIGTMAGGIAHDFNNILASIMGYAELNLMDMPEGSDMWQNQNEILVASSRAKEVINQILLFSKKEIEDTKSIKPAVVIKEAHRLLKTLVSNNVSLMCDAVDADIEVNISSTQLHQVVVNLCINANHAIADDEKGNISITLTKVLINRDLLVIGGIISAGEYALLEVSDTGSGIKSEYLPHIFEPFYTTKAVDKGTGMGLSVVYGIVTKAHGAIDVITVVGEGTRFRLYFPVVNTSVDHANGVMA